ncbi:MAG: type 4a pilus biogenesis protein PilO [Candidatus Omnitrophica bacterium]|nr:type 4a pilus biogenesis protein PilO [Candidatus Omnitrophota bacterium]
MNLDNIQNIQLDKQKKILIIIFCFFIVYVEANYILKAQIAGLKSLEPKIALLEKDLKNLNRDLENMRVSKGKPALEARKAASRSSKIITEDQVSGLLQDISSAANKFDVKIIQIRPSRETGKSAIAGDKFTPILINLDLICDYHNLGKFINNLENSPVFMGAVELKISARMPDYLKQKASLVIRTYVSK